MIVTEDRRSFKILVNNFEQRSGSDEIIFKDREQWGSFFNQDRDWDHLESKWSWKSQDRNQDRARRSWSRTFFDSRWSSVTRSWAKVVVLHKILIKIVRQNVPMIFATILAKTVLKIVSVVASIPVLIFSTRGWISLYVDVIGGSTVACWIWLATWIRLELIGSIPLRAQISLFNYLHFDWPR